MMLGETLPQLTKEKYPVKTKINHFHTLILHQFPIHNDLHFHAICTCYCQIQYVFCDKWTESVPFSLFQQLSVTFQRINSQEDQSNVPGDAVSDSLTLS